MTGKPICKPDGSSEKIKICMKDGQLPSGEPQSFYFPEGHPRAGPFKGMALILEERGFGDMSKTRAECKGFKCAPGATACCCHHILYNQPDFANVDSLLEAICMARGVLVLFLPKFHCELNFVEQCWGGQYRHRAGVHPLINDAQVFQPIPTIYGRIWPWIEWQAGSVGIQEVPWASSSS